jgi:hypothetical protein
VFVEKFSHLETYPKTGKRWHPKKPRLVFDSDLLYVTVHKTKDNGNVVKVDRSIIVGDPTRIDRAIKTPKVNKSINTSFIERTNLALRNHIRKLTRKTLCVAKKKQSLETQTKIIVTYYNFSRPHRGLTLRSSLGTRIKRTPAIAAHILDRICPISEILAYPV